MSREVRVSTLVTVLRVVLVVLCFILLLVVFTSCGSGTTSADEERQVQFCMKQGTDKKVELCLEAFNLHVDND